MLGTHEYVPCRVERQGGAPSRYVYRVQCSECPETLDWDNKTKLPDQVLKKKIEQKGWKLGKSRKHDLCPTCVAGPKLAEAFKTTREGKPVPTLSDLEDREAKETLDLLSRHFPMAEPSPKPKANQPLVIQNGMSPEMTLMLVQSLTNLTQTQNTIIKEMADFKAAFELMVEQQAQQVKHGQQLINAISQIVPAITRGNEAIASRLEHIARTTASPQELPQEQLPEAAEPDLVGDGTDLPVNDDRVVDDALNPAIPTRKFVKSDVVYMTSCQPPSGKGKWFTNINIMNDLAEYVGLEPGGRVEVERYLDTITIKKTEETRNGLKGIAKVKRSSKKYVTIQTFGVGDARSFSKGMTEIIAEADNRLKVRLA